MESPKRKERGKQKNSGENVLNLIFKKNSKVSSTIHKQTPARNINCSNLVMKKKTIKAKGKDRREKNKDKDAQGMGWGFS